jgi:O-methyltransferase
MTVVEENRALYLELLKRCLTNWIYAQSEWEKVPPKGLIERLLTPFLASKRVFLARTAAFDPEKRRNGLDWPPHAHTMIGLKRLENLQFCMEDVITRGVPGDFIETGVWRGGSTIFMRAILKSYAITDRTVWVADSFEGLPKPDVETYPADAGDTHHVHDELRVSLESVRANFETYGLLDDQVRFLKGWFRDTLPTAPIEKLAVLRLDGDMYESTTVALQSLYPKVSSGGFVIVDDYCIESCAKAVEDYRAANGITDEIHPIDGTGVFWRRGT